MFFGVGAKITNIADLETELNNLGFNFIGDEVTIGPVTFDFAHDWTDRFVQDISTVFRLEFDKILLKPDLPNDLHSINKIFLNFEDIADEILLLATTAFVMNSASKLTGVLNSHGYQAPLAAPSTPPQQMNLPLNYGNSNNPQASLTGAPAQGLKAKLSKNVAYSPSNKWQPVATTKDDEEEILEDKPKLAKQLICDCGAIKANTTHADWCSLKQ